MGGKGKCGKGRDTSNAETATFLPKPTPLSRAGSLFRSEHPMGTVLPDPVDYSQLHALRHVLAPQYAIMPTGQIRAHMEAIYGEGAADAYNEYLEGIFEDNGRGLSSGAHDVGRFAAKAAPVAATIGGGALQGALSGAQFGLPGIIAGAAI